MHYLKKIGISLLYSSISYLILLIVTTILSYFNILNSHPLMIFKLLIVLISIFIGSFTFGHSITKKGWLEGLKLGLIIISILIISNIIFYHCFSLKNIIYYFIILLTSILGGMIGIFKKKK